MLAFPCPNCQAILKAPVEKAGAHSTCRTCGSPVRVPPVAQYWAPSAVAEAPAANALRVPTGPGRRRAQAACLIGCGAIFLLGGSVTVGAVLFTFGLPAAWVGHHQQSNGVTDTGAPLGASGTPLAVQNKGQDLMVIYRHSPFESVGMLVRRNSPIPPGWEGGGGRVLSMEIYQAELHLAGSLSGGKEGQTARITR
jgi:hypothetical protein